MPGVIEGCRLPFKHAVSLVTVRCLVGEWEHLTRPDRLGIVVSPDRALFSFSRGLPELGVIVGLLRMMGLQSQVLRATV
jgi:hypothetical protein